MVYCVDATLHLNNLHDIWAESIEAAVVAALLRRVWRAHSSASQEPAQPAAIVARWWRLDWVWSVGMFRCATDWWEPEHCLCRFDCPVAARCRSRPSLEYQDFLDTLRPLFR